MNDDYYGIAYGVPQENGKPNWLKWVINQAHAKGKKVVLDIGGNWGSSATNMDYVWSNTSRFHAWWNWMFAYTKRKNADGVALDWEFPSVNGSTVSYGLQVMRDSLNTMNPPGLFMWTGDQSGPASYESISTFNQCIDIIFPMMYAYGQGSVVYHNTALYGPSSSNVCGDKAITAWLNAGVDENRLCMTVAFETYRKNGATYGGSGSGSGWAYSTYNEVVQKLNQYPDTYHWDTKAPGPYLQGVPPNNTFYSYEDDKSLAVKVEYGRTKQLGWIGIWNINNGSIAGTTADQRLLRALDSLAGDITPPPPPPGVTVSLSASPSSPTVGTQVTLTAATTGTVNSVTFRINNAAVGSDATAPYTYSWTPSAPGTYSLRATAFGTGTDSAVATLSVSVADTIGPPPPPEDDTPYIIVQHDNFNRSDQPLPGTGKWADVTNQPNNGTIRIVNNAIQAYSDVSGGFGAVVFDSLCAPGMEARIVVVQKSGNNSRASFMLHARMTNTDFLTGSGYRLRYREEAGDDIIEINRSVNGYGSSTVLASIAHEVNVGDTIKFRVRDDAMQTMEAYVNGTMVLTAQDTTVKTARWYFALRACMFPTAVRFDDFIISSSYENVTDIGDEPADVPQEYRLEQNYPNPFNPQTTITYTLPWDSRVGITVYSILGQEVSKLVDGVQSAGVRFVTWGGSNSDGQSVPSGLYFYRIEAYALNSNASAFVEVRKMLLVR